MNFALIENATNILKKYYINDSRPLCIAFSGGKDSTAILYIMINVLLDLKQQQELQKEVYIINSNTLAELPPLLKHLEKTLTNIRKYAIDENLPIKVYEVFPETKDTLNVQLMGVGMPPPSNTFRWCTDKLKVNPIDKKLKELFPDGKFISVIGTRKDESLSRSIRIDNLSIKNTDLKINDRYTNASNLMPIEDWTTKDVWEYLLSQSNDLLNIDFLWKLYSDASGKDATECSFVGAGGKNIEEGKIGCGVSRFGCWQCYMVRDEDKSLDGLMKSGHEKIELYREYRDWFWKLTQQGWEKTRDVYNHRTQVRDIYNKGGETNPKYGMTMPKGLTIKIRKEAFARLLKLQSELNEEIIRKDEIIEIQKRWILEGDLELSAFKLCKIYHIKVNSFDLSKDMRTKIREAKQIYKIFKNNKDIKITFSKETLKRFVIQYKINKNKCAIKFFPTKQEERHIRKEWQLGYKLNVNIQLKLSIIDCL
jgi:DNA sulfur modification protein DndC